MTAKCVSKIENINYFLFVLEMFLTGSLDRDQRRTQIEAVEERPGDSLAKTHLLSPLSPLSL